MTKIEALAKFLEVEVNEIEQGYDENNFETGNAEYLVLTDEEADQAASEYIKESVWAFNTDFIISHSSVLDFDQDSEDIVRFIQEKCESGNGAMLKLIDDIDEFIEDAISADGRGHFLNGYDFSEDEEGEYFIYRTN